MKKKTVALLMAMMMVVGCAIGGTLAWLTTTTEAVTNTFTVGDINIALGESDHLDLKMVPGNTITKDPAVTVEANSEACWLFVKIEKSDNYDTYLHNYSVANGWSELTPDSGVYYREVDTAATDTVFNVLADNQVTVKEDVTKAQMNALTKANYPTLTFTAYATQLYKNNTEKFDVAEAWEIAQGT